MLGVVYGSLVWSACRSIAGWVGRAQHAPGQLQYSRHVAPVLPFLRGRGCNTGFTWAVGGLVRLVWVAILGLPGRLVA